ncbi:hypothetical protein [Flavobacterium pedocola]
MRKISAFLLASLLFLSCSKSDKVEQVERAFYYWKSDGNLSDNLKLKLVQNQVKKVYVKYFEVDYSEAMGNFPYDKNQISEYQASGFEEVKIVPCVYIKNEIFQYNKEKDLDKLADNIVFLVDKYNRNAEKYLKFENEIQIDCDWTKSTKEKYFYLLEKIKELSKKNISCTLRLYPYKYPDQMGIPPVDKVTLMCYNLIKPLSNQGKNSILDLDELKSYLNERRDYPKHLDVALPVFGWTQLYQNNHFSGLLNMSSNELKSFTKLQKPLWYEVTRDTVINYDNYIRVGDQIKCEEVSAKTLEEAIGIIKKNVALDKTATISLFHLEENAFKNYSDEEISRFYDSFTK